jgi:hypothetical protein
MQESVFVDGWQMHCCGTPFSLGSTVTWDVEKAVNNAWLADLLGETSRRQVTYHQSDHGMTGASFRMVARVLAIEALTYHLEVDPDPKIDVPGRVLKAVSGSGRLTVLQAADGRESEPVEPNKSSFAGYIVEIDTTIFARHD